MHITLEAGVDLVARILKGPEYFIGTFFLIHAVSTCNLDIRVRDAHILPDLENRNAHLE